MIKKMTPQDTAERRLSVLEAARWCFLNFGFSKTSLDDIARRAGMSRPLLYKMFTGKEDIFSAVFAHWLIARLPVAEAAAERAGDPYERLIDICRVVVVEPWEDMAGAPMSAEFFDVCERIDPEITAQHRSTALKCVSKVLGSNDKAEVYLLALEGLLSDRPDSAALEIRVKILTSSFTHQVSTVIIKETK